MSEYWRWKEYRWDDPEKDWHGVTAGVDVGSVSSQAVVVLDGELYAFSSMRTGSNSPESAQKAMDWALEGTGLTLDGIGYVVGTGYGRVNVPFSDKAITEIACHARGANYMYGPSVRTVLDMGGQDCKVIRCDERGKVSAFLMNDKCAAGTGRGMEVFADLLALPIEEVGELSFQVDEEPASACVVHVRSLRQVRGHRPPPGGLAQEQGPGSLLFSNVAPSGDAAAAAGHREGVRDYGRHRQERRCGQTAGR
jgi:activator of 2-hydroxyglutaryl-CoA dehydratase